ncbi:hypothetical protein ABZZ47_09840 [Streptomyces sp. NPDC006465]|uniref:hypothetical protein n=1 Tax=Streptomyces sp. NPDC006465 TaxID=3157174 RepID=UPI0033A47F9D
MSAHSPRHDIPAASRTSAAGHLMTSRTSAQDIRVAFRASAPVGARRSAGPRRAPIAAAPAAGRYGTCRPHARIRVGADA